MTWQQKEEARYLARLKERWTEDGERKSDWRLTDIYLNPPQEVQEARRVTAAYLDHLANTLAPLRRPVNKDVYRGYSPLNPDVAKIKYGTVVSEEK